MRKLASVLLLGGLLAAAGLIATPVLAKRSEPTPAGIWVDLHFKSANGKVRTVVVPLALYRASQANEQCGNSSAMSDIAKGAYLDDPRLASMQFLGGNCEKGPDGKIKLAIGAWPAGKGPGYTSEPGLSVDVQPDLVAGAPAVVVLHFVATNGHRVNTVFGYSKKAAFYLRTCAARLSPLVPRLIAAAQSHRVATAAPGDAATRPYSLYGLKYVGAECVAPPHQIGDLGWPKASVEWSSLPAGIN